MSVTLTLIPLAVAVGVSLTASSAGLLAQLRHQNPGKLPPLETAFTDANLLSKTLLQHGLQVQVMGENEMVVVSESGILRYVRQDASQPFRLELENVCNLKELLDSVDELENEYGRNVQTFTYNKVMTSLIEHGMTVEQEEILEDDSILLTLNL